jgi:N4-gp56 family major capsid protein
MPFPVAPGGAAYTGNFIPEIWASKLIVNFYDATVLAAISNTDYEGEIKGYGDKVNIRTTPELTIRDYQKGMTLTVERPDKPKLTLNIDQGDYFAAVEDDVDKIQSDVNLMDAWSRDASEKMKIKIDSKVLTGMIPSISSLNQGTTAGRISGNINLGATGSPVQVTKANVIDYIVDLGTTLDEANSPESDRWLVIPAWMAAMIKKSDVKDASLTGDSQTPLRNGRIGMIDRFTVYVSHNLNKVTDSGNQCFSVLAGHKMGLTFASQMTNMESIRAESTFGSIIRGLQVYGSAVVKPEALARLYCRQ